MSERRASLLLGGVVLVGLGLLAASGNEAESPGSTRPEPPDTVVAGLPPEPVPASPTATYPEEEQPKAGADGGVPPAVTMLPTVITPLGIPVAVIGRSGTGYLVRTPCGDAAEVSTGDPIEKARVVLDPGHGGRWNTGAIGPNDLVESDLNLRLSRAVRDELADRGVPAVITRTGDYGMLISVRAAFADALRALGAEALISIHHNAPTWGRSNVPGTEVYVQSATTQRARSDSARLGGLLYEEITAALATFDHIAWSRLRDAGVLRVLLPGGEDAYGIVRRPAVPTALIEYGYLSNPSEAALFATDQYLTVAARTTADAIEAYLSSDRPGTGFIREPRVFHSHSHSGSVRCDDPPLE
ncbi:MAG: N-acetylmuramoyl-L-alanine amidase [bacterium]|nr:N-acetylmuramoyl-L-alanine amidase [bacterium]